MCHICGSQDLDKFKRYYFRTYGHHLCRSAAVTAKLRVLLAIITSNPDLNTVERAGGLNDMREFMDLGDIKIRTPFIKDV